MWAVEGGVRSHVQARQIHRRADDLGGTARLDKASGCAGQVPTAGVGADHGVGMAAVLFHKLMAQLPAQGLDAADAEGGVEGGVEIACLLQKEQHLVEELRSHGQLQHLRA